MSNNTYRYTVVKKQEAVTQILTNPDLVVQLELSNGHILDATDEWVKSFIKDWESEHAKGRVSYLNLYKGDAICLKLYKQGQGL